MPLSLKSSRQKELVKVGFQLDTIVMGMPCNLKMLIKNI